MSLTYEIQAEYVKSVQRGYGFAAHTSNDGMVTAANYMFRKLQLEPGVLREMQRDYGDAPAYIWTFWNCTMVSYSSKHRAPTVTPLNGVKLAEWPRFCPKP